MKRIIGYLKGKLEERKVDNKIKRVEIVLNSAELNFKSQVDDSEIKLEEVLEKFNDPENSVEDIIHEISEIMDDIDEAKEGLKKVERIRQFLFEES